MIHQASCPPVDGLTICSSLVQHKLCLLGYIHYVHSGLHGTISHVQAGLFNNLTGTKQMQNAASTTSTPARTATSASNGSSDAQDICAACMAHHNYCLLYYVKCTHANKLHHTAHPRSIQSFR